MPEARTTITATGIKKDSSSTSNVYSYPMDRAKLAARVARLLSNRRLGRYLTLHSPNDPKPDLRHPSFVFDPTV